MGTQGKKGTIHIEVGIAELFTTLQYSARITWQNYPKERDMEKEEILGRLDVFKGLTSNELKEIAQLCEDRKYTKDEAIFVQSSPGKEVYIVKKGKVHIDIGLVWQTDHRTIHQFTDGDVFGELAILDQKPRSATAICDSDTEVITINCDGLWDLFERNNHIGYVVIRNLAIMLSTRLRNTNLQLISSVAVT